uniref:Uncharacterized protein n=1 Tax=Rhizophagus irregularis (strain DAOM 181602 / DAOM 197198 / MUCL 43194) TaxID=747089 RepID=U9TGM1_RHIID
MSDLNFNYGNYDDFIKRFKRYDKWIIFYEKNIASPLLAKHRSARGSLASKVKDIMILQLLKGKKHLSKIQIAYAISICEIILNSKNLHIQVTESVIKPVLTKNLKMEKNHTVIISFT